jgi:hypothetical protein
MAHVLGATSATTKKSVTLRRVTSTMPAAPLKTRLANTPSRVDCTSWLVSATSSTGLSHSWCSTRPCRI